MQQYFQIQDGNLVWNITPSSRNHGDDLEFSAFGLDAIIGYRVDENGFLTISRYAAFPTLRTIPNNTHATFSVTFEPEKLPAFRLNDHLVPEQAVSVTLDGTLVLCSRTDCADIRRTFFPAEQALGLCERTEITNSSSSAITLTVPEGGVYCYGRGTKGVYVVEITITARETVLSPGDSIFFDTFYTARIANQPTPVINGDDALNARKKRVRALWNEASLDTGNIILDTMYRFAKLRAGESIFATQGGLLHSPGGQAYYAASWCNDQVEYAGPWFAATGDPTAITASENAYRQYIPFMSDTYHRIPCSVIAEGNDIWEGAGDRGDAAMYLYGASLFVLTLADSQKTALLWPAIRWCAEYCRRCTLPEGVIRSDSDELEGRFPTDGKANLATSCLTYGGLLYAAEVAETQGESALADDYRARASALEIAIERYFGATLHGYRTYRYSAGFDTLRAWICLPLCMGIETRLAGTLDAMFSSYLWTEDGMLTCERGAENTNTTVWDRSTLYGFRGMFLHGRYGEVWECFLSYCRKRLLCERVPYAVEAWPEGGRRHLSAESALFCRIVTEGILGIRPESMNSFSFLPTLPDGLDHLTLKNLRMNGATIDFSITAETYTVTTDGKTHSGKTDGKRVVLAVR